MLYGNTLKRPQLYVSVFLFQICLQLETLTHFSPLWRIQSPNLLNFAKLSDLSGKVGTLLHVWIPAISPPFLAIFSRNFSAYSRNFSAYSRNFSASGCIRIFSGCIFDFLRMYLQFLRLYFEFLRLYFWFSPDVFAISPSVFWISPVVVLVVGFCVNTVLIEILKKTCFLCAQSIWNG